VRIQYRLRQFWHTITIKIDPFELEQAMKLLTPEQAVLFSRLQPGEQAHALAMHRKLVKEGENYPDLLVAALLHDVGKLRHPLNPLERATIVVARGLVPEMVRQWGSMPEEGWESLPGWRRPFIVAEQHAAWGADLVHQLGVSPQVEDLIRRHHHPAGVNSDGGENILLQKLWAVDNES
jgi:putative nucleotidyltransferase with HDIG domain